MNNEPNEFMMAVRQMRYYQKRYSQDRDSRLLELSKKAEVKVDQMIANVFEPSLF